MAVSDDFAAEFEERLSDVREASGVTQQRLAETEGDAHEAASAV
jgi:hypothetical protein